MPLLDLKQFVSHEVLEGLLTPFFKEAGGKAADVLKTRIFGIGSVDELLSAEARPLAKKLFKVSQEKINWLEGVISECPTRKINKLTNVLGNSEKRQKKERESKDKNGKKILERETVVENIRGAMLIAYMANMYPDKEKVSQFLRNTGITVTWHETAKETIKALVEIWEELERNLQISKKISEKVIRPLEDWLDKNNLEKTLRKREKGYEKRGLLNFWSSPADLSKKKKKGVLF